MKYSTYALAFVLFGNVSAFAEDAPLEVQHQGTIPYVSGGIGREESDAMEAAQRDYNLRITSADRSGHFYGNTHVVVQDTQAQTLLDITGGPFFYAQMPQGHYVVKGTTDDGQTNTQKVSIVGKKPAVVQFRWPQEQNDFTSQ